MRYVLVGNGENADVDLLRLDAASFVHINKCRYAHVARGTGTPRIFVTNTGTPAAAVADYLSSTKRIRALKPLCIIARNKKFYDLKRKVLRGLGYAEEEVFAVWRPLKKTLSTCFKTKMVSLDESLELELLLIERGMPLNFMPSTGVIAYHWLRRRLRSRDELLVTGFSHEGWDHHPWALEHDYIKAIQPV